MNSTPRNWHQEPLVWMLVAIPLSSVLVGGVMLWFAIATEDGLVADDYYKRGLEINHTLERDAAAVEFSLTAELRFVAASNQIVATIDAGDGFVYPASLKLGLYHSVKSGYDKESLLERISDNVYAGTAPELIPGRWYLSLFNESWRILGQLTWPADSALLSYQQAQN